MAYEFTFTPRFRKHFIQEPLRLVRKEISNRFWRDSCFFVILRITKNFHLCGFGLPAA